MFGLMAELGPLMLNDDSFQGSAYEATGVPTLFYNPYGWTQLGSVLMFDWPPPVGYSFCNDDPAGDGFSCGAWNDTRAMDASYAALQGWYELFPEYKPNDLYLTGERFVKTLFC
jgi:carboxypeptidase C (cathepsin A)